MVDLPDLHAEHVFGLGHAETREAERESDCAGRAEVAAPVGEETGPILRGFEVELVDIEQKLLDFRRGEDIIEQRRRLTLVFVRHAIAEKRADCLKPADASDHLQRLVISLFFHIPDKYNGRSFHELSVDLAKRCESARRLGWLYEVAELLEVLSLLLGLFVGHDVLLVAGVALVAAVVLQTALFLAEDLLEEMQVFALLARVVLFVAGFAAVHFGQHPSETFLASTEVGESLRLALLDEMLEYQISVGFSC